MKNEPSEKEREWHDMLLGHYAKLKQARGDQVVVSDYSMWAAEQRHAWEKKHVVWFYGQNDNGGSTWGSVRPKPELFQRLSAQGQIRFMPRERFLAELAKAKEKKR